MKNWWENKQNPFEEDILIDLGLGHNAIGNNPTLITQQPDKTPLCFYEKEFLTKHSSLLEAYTDLKTYLKELNNRKS